MYALHAWERVHKHFIALITVQGQCHKIFGSGVLQSVLVHSLFVKLVILTLTPEFWKFEFGTFRLPF